MIRDNHLKRTDGVEEIQYRNALYQGEVKDGHFQGGGIVYFHDDDHLITCKHFQRSHINGPAFFIYDRGNYHFGEWKDSYPDGVSVFRIRETVIVAQYKNGSMLFGSKIVILIEASNVGVVAELMHGGRWQIRQKKEVYCMEHIEGLVQKCHFSNKQIELSLFRFISHRLNSHPFQLRYIQNHYKFGFEGGLSVNFDEQQHITQINTRKVRQIYQRSEKSQSIKVGQVYNNTTLSANESYFRNKALKDPSKCYFDQFSTVLDEGMIKSILSGFIMDPGNLSRSRNSVNQKSLVIEKLEPKIQLYISPRSTAKSNQQAKGILKVESYEEVFEQKQSPQSPSAQLGNSFKRSKLVRQPIKLYSFQQSPVKKSLYQKQPSPKGISASNQKPQAVSKIQLPITPQKSQQIKHNPSSKSKKKIFEKSPSKKDIPSQSPHRNKDESNGRPRQHRIFPQGQSKNQSSVKEQPKSMASNQKSRADSPIFGLKSEALKTQKQKSGLKRQATDPNKLNEKLQTVNGKLRAEISGKKRALTEFESDGEILSEDMSNLLDVNSTLQLNESPGKRIGKYNNIYRNQGKRTSNQANQPARKQSVKVKSNDNTPYLEQVYQQRQPRQFTRANGPTLPPKSNHSGPSQLRYQYF